SLRCPGGGISLGLKIGSLGKPLPLAPKTLNGRSSASTKLPTVRDQSERIDKLQLFRPHTFCQILGVIMHGHVKNIVEREPGTVVNFEEAPKPVPIFVPEFLIRYAGHEPEEKSNGFSHIVRLLTIHAGRGKPVLLLRDSDVERWLQPE